MTKGDNNEVDDSLLYPVGQMFVDRDDVVGVVRFYLPFLGWPSIIISQYQWLKVLILITLTVFLLINR